MKFLISKTLYWTGSAWTYDINEARRYNGPDISEHPSDMADPIVQSLHDGTQEYGHGENFSGGKMLDWYNRSGDIYVEIVPAPK